MYVKWNRLPDTVLAPTARLLEHASILTGHSKRELATPYAEC